jgi:antitoxin Phd
MKNSTRNTWQLQTAKAQFSEVVRRALAEGPQHITRRGKEEVVVIPAEQFERMTATQTQPKSLVQFLRESPLAKFKVKITRDKDYGRDIDL